MQQALVNMMVRRAKLKVWPRSVTRQGRPLSQLLSNTELEALARATEQDGIKRTQTEKTIVNVFLPAEDTSSHTRL